MMLSLAILFASESAMSPHTDQQITVQARTSWDGLGQPAAGPTAFDVTCTLPECPHGIRLLQRCLAASPKDRFQPDDLADVVSWLQTATPEEIQAVDGGVHHALYSAYALPRVRNEFEASRSDPALIRRVLTDYFSPGHRWTDDYPNVSATVILPDGETVTLSSRAQQAFMIPWTVTRSGRQYSTYEPNIGRALAALGPPRLLGRERLSGRGLKAWLVGEFFRMAFQKEGPHP